MINSIEELLDEARKKITQSVVVAGAGGREVLKSVAEAESEEILHPILVGDKDLIRREAESIGFSLDEERIISAEGKAEICRRSTELLADGSADVMMKGLVDTSRLMREILREKYDLKTERLISHIVLAEVPAVDRLFLISDGGMNINPSLSEKIEIIQNAINAARRLGWSQPKVALMAAVEKVRDNIPATQEAAILSKMADRGQIEGGLVDGPFALDNALSPEAARIKGIEGEVAGRADILITPDLNSGNLLGKSVIYMGGGRFAALLGGTRKPIVVTSRSDSADVRFISLSAAVVMAESEET